MDESGPTRTKRWRPGHRVPPRWFRWSSVALAVVLVCALVALVTARTDLSLGPHEARYEVTIDGQVTVDLGPLGTVELDSPAPAGIGVLVTVKEIPSDLSALEQSPTLEALTQDLQAYLQFFGGPSATIQDAIDGLARDALTRFFLLLVGAAAVLGLALLLAGSPRSHELAHAFAPHSATVSWAVVLLVVTLVVTNPSTVERNTAGKRETTVFAGTALEGARITGRLAGVVETYGGQLVKVYEDNETYYERLTAAAEAAWVERSEAEFAAAALRLPRPTADAGDGDDDGTSVDDLAGTDGETSPDPSTTGDGAVPTDATPSAEETAEEPAETPTEEAGDVVTLLHVSDLHCNVGMAPVIRKVAELSGASAILDTGDLTMNGTAVERFCVTTFANAAPDGAPYVLVTGNHDSAETASQARAAGMTVLDGGVVDVEGVRILGDSDPNETRPGIGTAQVSEEDVEAFADRMMQVACGEDERVDLLMVHTPRAGTSALSSGCVATQLSGHVHRRIGPARVGLGVRYVSSTTAGAAEGQLTVGPLRGESQMTVLRFDRETRRMLDMRVVVARPDGSVSVGGAVAFPAPLPQAEAEGGAESAPSPDSEQQEQDVPE
ncbi:calcineurin-like phosphoesterase family protein [Flavimobilis soli]|uniref:Calcineurin-like phosphoesterase family protein n=1 Tax=Flavimobilis soli TaxID=442709 RepID=A0A2A9EFY5_9MICO|nr:metallophosphoesterase [Flavimobilis soli]PFG35335.1 calcineurin-like phosphoesterase family protein [Flavimobilis soli]PFG37838.1 calcineurin-like phosphoesterase family protein [Flavimobilis soli]